MFFLVPFAICRLYQALLSKKRGTALQEFCEDAFAASQCLLLSLILPKAVALVPLALLTLAQLGVWYLAFCLKIPWKKGLWRFALKPSSFIDSAKALKVPQIAACGLSLTICSLCAHPSFSLPVLIGSFIGATLLRFSSLVPNFLFQWQKNRFRRKKKPNPEHTWNFPGETAKYLDPRYPILRKTLSFNGEKRFEIPLAPKERPHIIFLFLESFRAKNVGCLGAKIPASPCFDALAEKGILFTRFCTSGLQTSRAFLSSFFGIAPHLDTMDLLPYCGLPLIGLPEILKEKGYKSALIQGGSAMFDYTSLFFKSHGFTTVLGKEDIPVSEKTSWGVHDVPLLNFAADWLQKQTDPTFLSLFTISNHHPWEPPPNWHFPIEDKTLHPLYRRFLQTFSYSDQALQIFIDRLRQSGLLEKSLLFICGDHGQGMGEKNQNFATHNDLSQENLHVPLLLLAEGRARPMRIDAPASHADLLPTLLDLLDLQATHHSLGKSLARKSDFPVYFSIPGREIGCLKGSLKVVGSASYDLDKDPDEKVNLGCDEEMRRETESYFAAVDNLFTQKAWAPEELQKTPYELKLSSSANEKEWIDFLASQPPAPLIDLSHSHLTCRAVEAIGKEKGLEVNEIDISNSPLMTDSSLEWIAEHCPNLTALDASHCPLLTDLGVRAILQKCSRLRSLTLEGVDDLVDLDIPNASLTALNLTDCPNVRGESLARLVSQCPQLIYLSASLEKTTPEDLLNMKTKGLLYAWLSDGNMNGGELAAFCSQNPLLEFLLLDRFAHLTHLPLETNPRLQRLKIADCPHLGDAVFQSLAQLPLKELKLVSCPKLTGKGLERLLAIPNCKIVLSDCPKINPDAILDLRSRGLSIF